MNETELKELIERAKETNGAYARVENAYGETYCPQEMRIPIAAHALEAGMRLEDWNCVAEAYVILSDIEGVK